MYSRFLLLSLFLVSLSLASGLPSPIKVPRQVTSPTSIVANGTTPMGASQATTLVAASPTAVRAFAMPGTSIQVLPFGLGIYGGITALAIAAVAFVTWERVRYRKTFRQQVMLENNVIAGVVKR